MVKGKRKRLSLKIIVRCVLMAAVICIAICISGYVQYRDSIYNSFNNFGYQLGEVALNYIDGDRIASYVKTGEIDEAYTEMSNHLYNLYSRSGITSVYICIPDRETQTVTTIYDTRVHDAENPEIFALGVVDPIGANAEAVIGIYESGNRSSDYFIRKNSFGYNTSAILPVFNSENSVTAILVVDIPMVRIQDNLISYLLITVIITVVIVTAFIFILQMMLKKQVIGPLGLIAGEASEFIRSESSISEKLSEIKTNDEIEELAESILQMEKDIGSYVENLTAVTAEKERIGAELDIAKNIQSSMLPRIFPAFEDRSEFAIFASMDPAKEVGGDFYDFFMVDERHLAIVVADVSGKGVPAALFMVIGKTLIKDHTEPGSELSDVFYEVNNLLCESNSEGLFITAFEGVLDLVTGEFTYVNAGHEPPFIYRNGIGYELYKIKPGFVLAGMEEMKFKGGSVMLSPGDKIFQYTDGVTEATNLQNELYGIKRLEDVLNRHASHSVYDILPAVKADIDSFAGEAPQFDDITMLCLEYKEKMTESTE